MGRAGCCRRARWRAGSPRACFAWPATTRLLWWGTAVGSGLGVVLALGLWPRWALLGCLVLYASYTRIGQDFLSFQWDNLLLESAFFTLFITPGGRRLARGAPPHPLGVFLMQWLLVRLYVESGLAKLFLGDPTWRDLTAMATYWETAPLPTWLGWYVHQLPTWAQKASSAFTYVVELGLPLGVWAPRRFRPLVCAAMAAFQVVVIATANYGFFNYLSLALCLWVLDDGHLPWGHDRPATPRCRCDHRCVLATVLVVALTIVPFLSLVPGMRPLARALRPVRAALDEVRTINAYHLFAQMTLVRREAVIEGSNDGTDWRAYELHYQPGDVDRAPPFVAPHQPRVDFQMWFLLLGGRLAPWFHTLLDRLQHDPAVVAPLFARNPFPDAPPASRTDRGVSLPLHRRRDTGTHRRVVDTRAVGDVATARLRARRSDARPRRNSPRPVPGGTSSLRRAVPS